MAPIANLTVRISAQIAELQKSFADASKSTKQFQDGFEGMATRAATVGTFLGNTFSKIGSAIVSTLGGAISDAIKYAQQFQNAFLGLSGVAAAFGTSTEAATAAAKSLASDGMLPLADAATGLKNLLSAGFNLAESTRLMEAFKDSAAFGRSGALSFGDAVRAATEGVKNQNSALVDNAGVTKNLSVILKEAGYQLQDLSDATKGAGARQALYNGILKETAAQQGDAAKASQTYTGAMTALESSYQSLLATWGTAITQNQSVQIALTAVGDAFRGLTVASDDNKTALNLVSDVVAFLIRSFANLLVVFDKLQTGFAEMDAALSGTVRMFLVGIQKMTDVVIDFVQFIDKAPNLSRALGFTEGYADDIKKLQTFSDQVFTTQQHMNVEMGVTQKRSAAMHSTMQTLITSVRGTADAVDASRGKMAELGEATKPANVNKGGLASLSKDAKDLNKKLTDLISESDLRIALSDAFSNAIDDIVIPPVPDLPPVRVTLKNETKVPLAQMEHDVKVAARTTSDVFRDAFEDLPYIIRDVLSGGGGIGDVMVGVAGLAADRFTEAFRLAVDRQAAGGKAVTGGEKALGLAGVGIGSFMGGFSMGESGGKMKGALGGAASGAMMGAVAGPIGMGVGAVAGFVGGLFGGAKKAKEERKALEANRQALLDQFGGMENLRKVADSVGVSMDAAFNTKKPAEFEAAVQKLNDALEDQQKRIDGLNSAVDGLNTRAALFGNQFAKALEKGDTKKLAEIAQRAQPEFERLGLMVRDTFAGLLTETGNGLQAIQSMGPAFQTLDDGVSKFGLTSTAVIDELLTNFHLVNDEGLKPLFEQVTATGQVLKGLFDAKALSPEGFQAMAADIGASLQGIINKGGDVARTLALSQPVLQTLWEAQEQYGEVTDDTTKAILRQAEEQGIVGAHMKDTNEKILDVLLAIGKVLQADLPQYFDALKKPASDAAASIEGSFNNIEIKPLTIGYKYDALNKPPSGVSVPHMAAGGIVRRPTLALIGESGPEAVVPLSGSALGTSASYETTILLDGEVIAKSTARRMPRYMREMGVGH